MTSSYNWYDPSPEQRLAIAEQIAAEGGPTDGGPVSYPFGGGPVPQPHGVILTSATSMVLDGGGADDSD